MTINRKALFAMAWTIARQDQWSLRLPSVRGLFGEALRKAWAEMRRRAELAQMNTATDLQSAASLQAQIRDLENQDTLGFDGLALLTALRAAYTSASARQVVVEPKPAAELWTPPAPVRPSLARPARAVSIAVTLQNPARPARTSA